MSVTKPLTHTLFGQSDPDHWIPPLHAPHQRLLVLCGFRLPGHRSDQVGLLREGQRVSVFCAHVCIFNICKL